MPVTVSSGKTISKHQEKATPSHFDGGHKITSQENKTDSETVSNVTDIEMVDCEEEKNHTEVSAKHMNSNDSANSDRKNLEITEKPTSLPSGNVSSIGSKGQTSTSGTPASTSITSGREESSLSTKGTPSSKSITSGIPASISSSSGRPATTPSNSGRPAPTSSNSVRPASTSSNSGRPASTSSNSGRPASTSSNSGRPASTSSTSVKKTSVGNSSVSMSETSDVCVIDLDSFNSSSTSNKRVVSLCEDSDGVVVISDSD